MGLVPRRHSGSIHEGRSRVPGRNGRDFLTPYIDKHERIQTNNDDVFLAKRVCLAYDVGPVRKASQKAGTELKIGCP